MCECVVESCSVTRQRGSGWGKGGGVEEVRGRGGREREREREGEEEEEDRGYVTSDRGWEAMGSTSRSSSCLAEASL